MQGIEQPLQFEYEDYSYSSIFSGLNRWLVNKIEATKSNKMRQKLTAFMNEDNCSFCEGSRLCPESRAVRVKGLRISDYCSLTLNECLKSINKIELSSREEAVVGQVVQEISNRLKFMLDLGLSYLALDRTATSLSGGETQRGA